MSMPAGETSGQSLGDLAFECEAARELLREALTLRMFEERTAGEWSNWDLRAERFLRDSEEGEQ